MKMSEKVERSRQHAAAALAAYRGAHDEQGSADPDDVAAIGDLIADLLLLAESLAAVGEQIDGDGVATLALRAIDAYEYEADPANADEDC